MDRILYRKMGIIIIKYKNKRGGKKDKMKEEKIKALKQRKRILSSWNNFKKSSKGITLIALVITIIVLLILARVSIATLTGENGILTRAQDAKEQTEIASVKEQAQLDIANWVADEMKNGEDATVNTPEKVKEILEVANLNNENKYYKELQTDKIITPSGYEILYEELYTNSTTVGEVTEVTAANYGDKVDGYISQKEKDEGINLIWRIFYDDDNYVYLISSKADGSNTVESCQLNQYPGSTKTYSGSEDITDSFLQSLNSQWFDIVKDAPSTNGNAKAVAYLMDQDVWDKYKDSEGNATYAIGGPTLELFKNSYNKSEETTNEIEITNCTSTGYSENTSSNWLLETYNKGIYNNGTGSYWRLASPGSLISHNMLGVNGGSGNLYDSSLSFGLGLRPIVIIPKSKFQYKIIPEM